MNEIFYPKSVTYVGNRFGEICPNSADSEEVNAMIETALTVIADRCYPMSGMGVECAHIVVIDNPFARDGVTNSKASGILVEFELDDGVKPSAALIQAMNGISALAGPNVAYVLFGGGGIDPEVTTFNDRHTAGVFIELDTAMREGAGLVQRHADRLGSLMY